MTHQQWQVHSIDTLEPVASVDDGEAVFLGAVAHCLARGEQVYVVVGPACPDWFRDELAGLCPVVFENLLADGALIVEGDPSGWSEYAAELRRS